MDIKTTRQDHDDDRDRGLQVDLGTSVRNMARVSLSMDNVFSNGWTTKLATMPADVTSGCTATVTYVA